MLNIEVFSVKKMNKIDFYLKKLQKKIWLRRFLHIAVTTGLLVSIALLLFMIFLHFTPINLVLNKVRYLLLLGLILILVGVIFKKPSLKETALIGDTLGMQERLITYWEFKNTSLPLLDDLIEETEDRLNSNFLKQYKVNVNIKKILLSFFIIILSVGIYFIPSTAQQTAWQRQEINKSLKEEVKNVQEIKKELENENPENDSENEAFLEELDQLEKQLRKSFTYQEAALQVGHTQKSLSDQFKKNNLSKTELTGIFQGLAGREQQELFNALENDDLASLIQTLEETNFSASEQNQMLSNIEELQKKDLLSKGEQLAELKNSLEKGADSAKKLANLLKEQQAKKKAWEKVAESETKLQSMKERLLAKSGDGFKGLGGQEKNSEYALGENDNLEQGELTEENSQEIALGKMGNKSMSSSTGKGGGEDISASQKRDAAFGDIAKEAGQGTNLQSQEESIIQGEWEETGKIVNRDVDDVIAVEGESTDLPTLYKQFQKEKSAYVYKFNIPLEDKDLVHQYFNQLSGGQ